MLTWFKGAIVLWRSIFNPEENDKGAEVKTQKQMKQAI